MATDQIKNSDLVRLAMNVRKIDESVVSEVRSLLVDLSSKTSTIKKGFSISEFSDSYPNLVKKPWFEDAVVFLVDKMSEDDNIIEIITSFINKN